MRVRDEEWLTFTNPFGWHVSGPPPPSLPKDLTLAGIWQRGADGTDVNAVCAAPGGGLLLTGDDSGKVRLFRFPCADGQVRRLLIVFYLFFEPSFDRAFRWTPSRVYVYLFSLGTAPTAVIQVT